MGWDYSTVFSAGTVDIKADKSAMSAMRVLAGYVGMDALYGWVSKDDYGRIANAMVGCEGYSGPIIVSDLADELVGAFDIYAERNGDMFKISDSDSEPLSFNGNGVRLSEAAKALVYKAISESPAHEDGRCMMQNLCNHIASMCSGNAAYGISPRSSEPAAPQATRTVVRERVIERETPPVLETMLREAIAKALVDIDVDSIYGEVRKRVIEEFGAVPTKHIVKLAEVEREVSGIVHREFDTVLHWVANDVPVFLVSGAGAGKNVLCKQVAEALGLDYHFANSVTDEFKISGFIDAYGNYHETEFYKAFKNGGLFFIDEMDASAPEVLVCLNAAISNRYFAFPNGYVEAHPDFRVVAAGNSLGTGGMDGIYTARMQLDAASLNRFVIVKMDYDRDIDLHCAGGDEELVEFFAEFRKAASDAGLPIVASYRNIEQMRIAKDAMPLDKAFQSCLCKEMNQDDINIVAGKIGTLRGNRYAQAFAGVKSLVG